MKKLILMLFLSYLPLFADVTIEMNDSTKVVCKEVDGSGSILKIMTAGKGVMNKSFKEVKKIIQPAPAAVASMIKAFNNKKFKAVASEKGKNILKKYRNSGWGQRLSYIYAVSLMRSNQVDEASKVLSIAKTYIAGEFDEEDIVLIDIALCEFLYLKKKYELVTAKMQRIKIPNSKYVKVYFYNLQGRIMEALNKENLAVIDYYKAVLLGDVHPDRDTSAAQINAIYKKQGDVRVLRLSKIAAK
jgi:hypothetical protein